MRNPHTMTYFTGYNIMKKCVKKHRRLTRGMSMHFVTFQESTEASLPPILQ